jgi:hypothetical protein
MGRGYGSRGPPVQGDPKVPTRKEKVKYFICKGAICSHWRAKKHFNQLDFVKRKLKPSSIFWT